MKLTYRHTRRICYLCYICGAVINNFTPLLFIIFQKSFGLSLSQLSLLITLNFGTQLIVDFLGAHYADKIGYRTSIVAANVFACAGLAALGILPLCMAPYPGLMIAVVLYAVGSGLMEVLVSPIVEALPMDGKAASMSFLHSFYCWGQMLTVLVTTAFFALFGQSNWWIMCLIWALLPAVTAALFTKTPINSFTNEEIKVPIGKLFGIKIFWVFLLLMLCAGASEIAMAQWASLFAETSLNVSKAFGDVFGSCMFAVFMGISRVIYGKLADRVDLKKYIILSAILCVASYLLASLSPNSLLSLFGCMLCGFSVGVMWPGVLSLAAAKCPEGGTALFGFLAMAGDVGCCSGPWLAAVVSEQMTIGGSGLKAGLLACIIFPIVMIAGTLILKKRKTE